MQERYRRDNAGPVVIDSTAQEVGGLYGEGCLCIGCACCTRPCKEGEDECAGRSWRESPDRQECGQHLVFKQGSGIFNLRCGRAWHVVGLTAIKVPQTQTP